MSLAFPTGRTRSRRRTPRRRRGSIYFVVMATAVVVSLIGLSALVLQRLQRQAVERSSDAIQAQLNAQAAIEMGVFRLQANSNWRSTLPNGVWESDVPLGGGSYTLEGTDPSDSQLADAAGEPLLLVGTGSKGQAQQKFQVMVVPEPSVPDALEQALTAAGELRFNGARVFCDQTLGSNGQVVAVGSTVNADVRAAQVIVGGTFTRTTTSSAPARQLPDFPTVLAAYQSLGTPIDIASLPLGFSNLLENPGIEVGTLPWQPSSFPDPKCNIARESGVFRSGTASLKVTSRDAWNAGPIQDLTPVLQSGVTYQASVWIRMAKTTADAELALCVNSTGSPPQVLTGGRRSVSTSWVQLVTTFSPLWNGILTSAYLKVQTPDLLAPDFYIDDAAFQEADTARTIYREVLSPGRNPFGQTNPQGVYVLDCKGAKLRIKCSRILGTLVILNPGPGSSVGGGPVAWKSAVANYPALIPGGDILIYPTNTPLAESAWKVNFNPPGSPDSDLGEDTTLDDTYPSEIRGWIYVGGKLTLQNQPVVRGTILASGMVWVEGDLMLLYDPICRQNIPPGLAGPERFRLLLNSAGRTP